MNQTLDFNPDHKQTDSFIKAMALHLGLVGIAFILQLDIFKNMLPTTSFMRDVREIKSAVRVDVVGMPKFTLPELKNMDTDSSTVETGDNKEAPAPEKEAVAQLGESKFQDMLKNLSKKNVGKAPPKNNGAGVKGLNRDSLKSLILEGNQISSGSATVGDTTAEELSEYERYVTSLPDIVRRFWKLPSYLLERTDLKCRVRIFISSQGQIIKTEMYESSGVEEFDQRALMSVQSANPFPPPTPKIIPRLVGGQVILGFPL